MKYWDSSALVPLFVEEEASSDMRRIYKDDPGVLSWVFSDIEVVSAFERLSREKAAAPREMLTASAHLDAFWTGVQVIHLVGGVKARARRLLRLHALGAADALQLSAALVAAQDDPKQFEFVCLDKRLRAAGEREGFRLLPAAWRR